MSATISGNDPIEEPTTPESEETTENLTQNITYEIDNTEVCELLSQLLEEVKKANETNSKIYEAMLLHHTDYLQNCTDSMELLKALDEEETEEETEEPETETQSYEDFMEEQILLIGENLGKINVTVSGNNALLTGIDETTETLAETYNEQTETAKQTTSQSLALGIGILFVVAVIAGLKIAKIGWGRMK